MALTVGAVVIGGLWALSQRPAVIAGPTPGVVRTVDLDAIATAGCVEVPALGGDLRDHLDPADAPSAEALYGTQLPAMGEHYGTWLPVVDGLRESPLDPRAVLHNMEHGSVAVWVDAAALDARELEAVAVWRGALGRAGFDIEQAGASIFVSRMPTTSDEQLPTVALRAWGVAIDCPVWNVPAADAFVAQHYGSRGDAPEGFLGPYPDDNGVIVGPPGARDPDTTTALGRP